MEESQQHSGAQLPGSIELARLRAYSAELRRLIELRDRTPPKWKYFQTEWLWFYTRGLIAGAWHMESFFHSLKAELTRGVHFPNEQTMRKQLGNYIRYYNAKRLHSALGYHSPIAFERAAA